MTFQATTTEYSGYTINLNEKEKTISLSQIGSILKLFHLFPPKSFTKTTCSPFLRTIVINEDAGVSCCENYENICIHVVNIVA